MATVSAWRISPIPDVDMNAIHGARSRHGQQCAACFPCRLVSSSEWSRSEFSGGDGPRRAVLRRGGSRLSFLPFACGDFTASTQWLGSRGHYSGNTWGPGPSEWVPDRGKAPRPPPTASTRLLLRRGLRCYGAVVTNNGTEHRRCRTSFPPRRPPPSTSRVLQARTR